MGLSRGPVEDGDDREEVKELHDGVVRDRFLLKASVPRRKWEDEDVGFGWKELED